MRMHAELNAPGSCLKKLFNNPLDKTPDIERWLWISSKTHSKSDYPMDEISEYIKDNKSAMEIMSKYQNQVTLTISLCWNFLDGKIHGFYASKELIHDLDSFGFGLEIDIDNTQEI